LLGCDAQLKFLREQNRHKTESVAKVSAIRKEQGKYNTKSPDGAGARRKEELMIMDHAYSFLIHALAIQVFFCDVCASSHLNEETTLPEETLKARS
jgi:hypothetical protein